MNRNAIISTAIGVVITFVLTAFLTSGKDIFNRGTEAIAADQIREILREEMKADVDGESKTYGQILSSLHTKVSVLEAQVGVLVEP